MLMVLSSAAIRHVWDHTQTGACKSVVCDRKSDLNDTLWRKKPVKKETETTLFRPETTQQKQHTTHNYSIYSSVAISVHCCLHWCSHLTSIQPSCIGVRTLQVSIAARCLVVFSYRWQWRRSSSAAHAVMKSSRRGTACHAVFCAPGN